MSKYSSKIRSEPQCAVQNCTEMAKFIVKKGDSIDWLCVRHCEEIQGSE